MNIKFPFNVDEFFEKCVRNNNFPKNDFEKQAILIKILDDFEDNKVYLEEEVNNIIKKYFDDAPMIRRELVNYYYMGRDPYKGEYKVKKRILTEDDVRNSTLLRRHAQSFKVLPEDKD